MSRWFICQQETVSGPFSAEEIKAQMSDGRVTDATLVWGRTQNTWLKLNSWLAVLPQMAATQSAEQPSHQLWHYAINGVSTGPLTRAELVNELKSISQKDQALVWTKGMKAWVDLFEFHDLLDEVGLNRREHPRVSISGTATLKYDNKILIGQVKTISPGGVGIVQINSQLAIGQSVNIEVKCPELGEPIHMKAICQYVTDAGFFGFKAQSISMEAQSSIIDYIKQQREKTVVHTRAA